MGFMRTGEDSTNSNPANQTARDQALTRLIFLRKGMKRAPTARGHDGEAISTRISRSGNADHHQSDEWEENP
jgi:hypothetical protein